MHIRRSRTSDQKAMVDVWLCSVRATHDFLTEEDIQSLLPLVEEYLTSNEPELWVLVADSGAIMGFMGLSGSNMDSLFLAPAYHRQGGGRRFVQHAQELRGELTVDVNEQNLPARRFYEACGFVVEGRSETDSGGRPFPVLHLRRKLPDSSLSSPRDSAPAPSRSPP